MAPVPTQIVIELDPRAVPISGHIRVGSETPLSFTGWTGLFALLRAAAGEEVAFPLGQSSAHDQRRELA